MDDPKVFRLAYVSIARVPFNFRSLSELEEIAQSHNRSIGVCGVLVTDQHHFIQVLEGAEKTVRELYARIMSDPRHHHLKIFAEEYTSKASFEQWFMGVINLTERPPEMTSVFKSMFRIFRETPVLLSLDKKRLDFFHKLASM